MLRRGHASLGALVGLPIIVGLTAWALAVGIQPWVILATALGGALFGGIAVFLSHRFWGAQVLRSLERNTLQLGTVATETSIVTGELYQLRAEIASLRSAIGLSPQGTHPPPAPRGAEE